MPDEDMEESGTSSGPLKSGTEPRTEEDEVEGRVGVGLRGGAVSLVTVEADAIVKRTPNSLSLNVSPVGTPCSKLPAKTEIPSH